MELQPSLIGLHTLRCCAPCWRLQKCPSSRSEAWARAPSRATTEPLLTMDE